MTHSKYLQLKKNCENISKSQHSRDKLARKWVKKTLGNEKKPVYKYIPDYLQAWYNIKKESNHQKKKKRKKSFKMKLKKKTKKKTASSLGQDLHLVCDHSFMVQCSTHRAAGKLP